jgi:hypothetical protein
MFAQLTLDENVLIANFGNGSLLVEVQVVEGTIALSLDTPLLLGRRSHYVCLDLSSDDWEG